MSEIAVEKPKKEQNEHWISTGFASHAIICMLTNPDTGKREPKAVEFKKYNLVLDLKDAEDKEKSEELKKSGRYGRDLFIVGEANESAPISEQTEMLKKLREMPIDQLRAMLTLDDIHKIGLDPGTRDPEELIVAIMKLKSF